MYYVFSNAKKVSISYIGMELVTDEENFYDYILVSISYIGMELYEVETLQPIGWTVSISYIGMELSLKGRTM